MTQNLILVSALAAMIWTIVIAFFSSGKLAFADKLFFSLCAGFVVFFVISPLMAPYLE